MISTVFTGCKKQGDIKEAAKIKPTPTAEACEFINEWDKSLFEVFGFANLEPPYRSHYPEIEKGRTYIKGQFMAENYDAFEKFFCDVYKVMWGEILDASQVLKKEGSVYSFSGEYVVTEIYRAAVDKLAGNTPRAEKYAWIKVTYDDTDKKCVIECRMLAEPSKE